MTSTRILVFRVRTGGFANPLLGAICATLMACGGDPVYHAAVLDDAGAGLDAGVRGGELDAMRTSMDAAPESDSAPLMRDGASPSASDAGPAPIDGSDGRATTGSITDSGISTKQPVTRSDAARPDAGDPLDGCKPNDFCDCPRPRSECSIDSECSAAQRCLPGVCGEMRCEDRGAPCQNDDECPAESRCQSQICVHSSSNGCLDNRDCPLGYECEAVADLLQCVDRRAPCLEPPDCPDGMICQPRDDTGGYCVRVQTPCASVRNCSRYRPIGGEIVCVDIDGDSRSECFMSGACDAHTDCGTPARCTISASQELSYCSLFGSCSSSADCGDGVECAPLSHGASQCVLPGGECRSDSDCGARELCTLVARSQQTTCFGGLAL